MKKFLCVITAILFAGCSPSASTEKLDGVLRENVLQIVAIPPNNEIQKVVGDAFCIELDARIHGVELVPAYYEFVLEQFRSGFEIDNSPNLELDETASVLIIPKHGKATRVCVFGGNLEERDFLRFSVNGVRLKSTRPYNDGVDISYRLFECIKTKQGKNY
jgi:hypothetical protein